MSWISPTKAHLCLNIDVLRTSKICIDTFDKLMNCVENVQICMDTPVSKWLSHCVEVLRLIMNGSNLYRHSFDWLMICLGTVRICIDTPVTEWWLVTVFKSVYVIYMDAPFKEMTGLYRLTVANGWICQSNNDLL